MLQIAICDDNADELEKTYGLIESYHRQNQDMDIACRKFQSGVELLDCLDAGSRYDIYLLDILMPDKDGIEVGTAIRELDREAAIIFLSGSDEFGIKSYRARAYDYLIKPVDKQRLFDTLDELVPGITDRRTSAFPIKVKSGIRTIQPHRLVYVEYQNHKCYYHLDDGSMIESITLREPFDEAAARILADHRFVKITIAYLVNMAYIKSIEGRELLLTDGKRLSVSRSCITCLRKNFMTYLLERGRGK